MRRLKILDWYVHQGTQYEMSKLDHDIFLVGADGKAPDWNSNHRPLRNNLHLISENRAKTMNFDIVIIRTPIASERYRLFINKGAIPIAVIQTTDAVWMPREVRHIVWNSREAMKKNIGFYRNRKQHYIVHGYDPDEFKPDFNIEKNGKVLTVANHFKKRSEIMGFPLWQDISREIRVCDVVGSKNEDIPKAIDHLDSLADLVNCYNSYSIYFNPTRFSAMPRTRAEAAMCGLPIVTTMYYDFKYYFKPNQDAIMSNDRVALENGIKRLLESEALRKEYGERARELAIQHFHIKDFLDKWNHVFDEALR